MCIRDSPSTCEETLPAATTPEFIDTQFTQTQIECGPGLASDIHCLVPSGTRTTGVYDYKPVEIIDSNNNNVPHYRCKYFVRADMTLHQCANEAFKRFGTYNGETWLSRGYFAVERPQMDAALYSSLIEYYHYNFDTSNELSCYVYKDVNLPLINSGTWDSNSQSFCNSLEGITLTAGQDIHNKGCSRAALLYDSVDPTCPDCNEDLPQYGSNCNSPVFVKSYYIPNLETTGVPLFTINPILSQAVTCYVYGPCFSDTEEWLDCRPTLLTGSVPSLHYAYYKETPLHEMTDDEKVASGISSEEDYLENMDFDTVFGFWDTVRDKVTGEGAGGTVDYLFDTYKKDWLNLCYDDMEVDDGEKVLLANRELYKGNDYTQYHQLFFDIVCPSFASKNKEYNSITRGRFASFRWADGSIKNRNDEFMVGSSHTKLQRIQVDGIQANYINHFALVILDIEMLDEAALEFGDPLLNMDLTGSQRFQYPYGYDDAIKLYCDAGQQRNKRYGPCLNLKGASVNGKIYFKSFGPSNNDKFDRYTLKEVKQVVNTLPSAVEGDVYVEHDCVLLVFKDGLYHAIRNFTPSSTIDLAWDKFKIYIDTQRSSTAHAEPMFSKMYREAKAALENKGQVCAPMSQDLTAFTSKLDATAFPGNTASSNDGFMFLRPQTLEIVKNGFCQSYGSSDLGDLWKMESGIPFQYCGDVSYSGVDKGYAPSCGCIAGFANVRYTDYNQPWGLHVGCSAPEGDRTGTMIAYKPCLGKGSCSGYSDTPYCCGYDPEAVFCLYPKQCVNVTGYANLIHGDSDWCNKPFGGCKIGQRNALNIDNTEIECQGSSVLRESFNGMATEWIEPWNDNYQINPNIPRTKYNGTNPEEGVVYVNGKPKDRARSNYAFITPGCHACTNGRWQDGENQIECRSCSGGKYNIDKRNPWRVPPDQVYTDTLNGVLPQDRWKNENEPAYEYEWWKVKGFPGDVYDWHEVNEWQVKAPKKPYYKKNNIWFYNPMIDTAPTEDPGWGAQDDYYTDCHKCFDNWASIPLANKCSDCVNSNLCTATENCPAGNLLWQVGDQRIGYDYPAMGDRSGAGNRNCLACPPGYDTGVANHLSGGDTPTTGGIKECPIKFAYAFSTKGTEPYYGSHCCKEKVDTNNDRFGLSTFYNSEVEACPYGYCRTSKSLTAICRPGAYPVDKYIVNNKTNMMVNNLEYCLEIGNQQCNFVNGVAQGVVYIQSTGQCGCVSSHDVIYTDIPDAISCIRNKTWAPVANCKYTKFLDYVETFGPGYILDVTLDYQYDNYAPTEDSRASTQYQSLMQTNADGNLQNLAASVHYVGPNRASNEERRSKGQYTYRTNVKIHSQEACLHLATVHFGVSRFSWNRVTGECRVILYGDTQIEKELRNLKQECQADEEWMAWELKLSSVDPGDYTLFQITEEDCLDEEFNAPEKIVSWTTEYTRKTAFGGSVEENPSTTFTSREAAQNVCNTMQNCIGVGSDSLFRSVRFWFPLEYSETTILYTQKEQSELYFRKILVEDQPYYTRGFFWECQPYATISGVVSRIEALSNCDYDPSLCYSTCRSFAEDDDDITAFQYPHFGLGKSKGPFDCKLFKDNNAKLDTIGQDNEISGIDFANWGSCTKMKNHFTDGFVSCDANYDQSGLEAQNGFYCADFDYRVHIEDYVAQGGVSDVSEHYSHWNTCDVPEVELVGTCEVKPSSGVCTSYNIHGECQTYNYKGKCTKKSDTMTIFEQNQLGTCVSKNLYGTCVEASTVGSCNEESKFYSGFNITNPMGLCTYTNGEFTTTRLIDCQGVSWDRNRTFLISNENYKLTPHFAGPFDTPPIGSVIKTTYFYPEDVVDHCALACLDTDPCEAFVVENRLLDGGENVPYHLPAMYKCELYGSFQYPFSFTESLSGKVGTNTPSTLTYHEIKSYAGRAIVDTTQLTYTELETITLTSFANVANQCGEECDKKDACKAFTYDAEQYQSTLQSTGSIDCILMTGYTDYTNLYKKHEVLIPDIRSYTPVQPNSFTEFDKAFLECERRTTHNAYYKERYDPELCQGIEYTGTEYKLIAAFWYGSQELLALDKDVDTSCSTIFTNINTQLDCIALLVNRPRETNPVIVGAPTRFYTVDIYSYNPSTKTCKVIHPDYNLELCPAVASTGSVVYRNRGDDTTHLQYRKSTTSIIYTVNKKHGSDFEDAYDSKLWDGSHGGSTNCLRSLGTKISPENCVQAAIDESKEVIYTSGQHHTSDSPGTCERYNDRGTLVQKEQVGHCEETVEDYGECVQQNQYGVCTTPATTGTCTTFTTCQPSIFKEEGYGTIEYENPFGDCVYNTNLGTCTIQSKLGSCEYENKEGTCLYENPDGDCYKRYDKGTSTYTVKVMEIVDNKWTGVFLSSASYTLTTKQTARVNNLFNPQTRTHTKYNDVQDRLDIKETISVVVTTHEDVYEYYIDSSDSLPDGSVSRADCQTYAEIAGLMDEGGVEDRRGGHMAAHIAPPRGCYVKATSQKRIYYATSETVNADSRCNYRPQGDAYHNCVKKRFLGREINPKHLYSTVTYENPNPVQPWIHPAGEFDTHRNDDSVTKEACEAYARNNGKVWFEDTGNTCNGQGVQGGVGGCPKGCFLYLNIVYFNTHTNGYCGDTTSEKMCLRQQPITTEFQCQTAAKNYAHTHGLTEIYSQIYDGECRVSTSAEWRCPIGWQVWYATEPGYSFGCMGETCPGIFSDSRNLVSTGSRYLWSPRDSNGYNVGYHNRMPNNDFYKCLRCPPGSKGVENQGNYLSYNPNNPKTACLICEQGLYQDEEGSTTSCKSCSAGTYNDIFGQTACKICPTGQYQDEEGSTTGCKECSTGYYQSQTGLTSCSSCPAGQYQNEEGKDSCKSCVAGTYSSSGGASSCATCDAGQYSDARAETCTDCAAGTYQNEIAKGTCKNCAVGQSQEYTASTSCMKCDTGHYQDQTGQSSCKACAEGQYQDRGPSNSGTSTSCKDCPKGRYADSTGNMYCTRCNSAKYQDETGQSECKTMAYPRCKRPTNCQHFDSSQGVWVECHSYDWARSCVYGGNTNNCRFSHHPNGCVGNGHGDVSSASSSYYALTKTGYENCYYYCWQRHQGVSDGFFQISAHRCYCYASGCKQNGGTYTFKMNC